MTDYLQEAVEAFRAEVHEGPGKLLLNGTMVRRGLRAVEPILEAHYREKLEARLLTAGAEIIARREYQAHCESMDTPAAWSAETPEHRECWLVPAREHLRAALQVDEETTRA